jgi:hypothetical protein
MAGELTLLRHKIGVVAGLDPAIHLLAKKMDPRVKPAGDAQRCTFTRFQQFMTQ